MQPTEKHMQMAAALLGYNNVPVAPVDRRGYEKVLAFAMDLQANELLHCILCELQAQNRRMFDGN